MELFHSIVKLSSFSPVSEQLQKNNKLSLNYIEVRLEDVSGIDAELSSNLSTRPQEYLGLVCISLN